MRLLFWIILAILINNFFLLNTDSISKIGSDNKLIVYTVNYPLKYFADRIGGNFVEVIFPAPPDVDPAFWTPDAKTIRAYQKADLILLNGADYAKWIKIATLPRSKLVDTSVGFKDRYIKVEDAVTHTHGPQGEHAHTGVAFTTWLDPLLAIEQANAIKEAFIKLMPGKKEIFETNFQSLKKVLSDLDKAMSAIVSKDPDKPLVASHPVYQYLARRYNLNLKSVQWEPDVFPVLNQWKELGVILESNPSHWMIWEDTPIKETTERLESIEINSIVFNPCGNIPENGDYISVMKQNVENLKIVF